GHVGEQPAGEVLLADPKGPGAAPGGGGELAAVRGGGVRGAGRAAGGVAGGGDGAVGAVPPAVGSGPAGRRGRGAVVPPGDADPGPGGSWRDAGACARAGAAALGRPRGIAGGVRGDRRTEAATD